MPYKSSQLATIILPIVMSGVRVHDLEYCIDVLT